MKLLVPYVGELQPVDGRLIRLAEFLGIMSEQLPLTKAVGQWGEYLERVVPEKDLCFVVNPRVMQDWAGGDRLPAELASFLVMHFAHLLVHATHPNPFDNSLVTALSGGYLQGVQGIERSDNSYEISPNSRDVCEAFAGLSFGPTRLANDRVFAARDGKNPLQHLISIAGRPFMATMRWEKSKVWFVAGENIADLDDEAGDAPVSEYFSRLLPHAMALRSIFGEESWRPSEQHASIIIDDPLLRRDYGFLNFESLLGLMKRQNFHTTIAFIPHNFRRSSPRITRMFRDNADRFALCFHGNDHTGAEFASSDSVLLNTLLQIAEHRMDLHGKMTGVNCDRVMVFPQGHFSVEAMRVLKSRNFDCAVNTTPHPMQHTTHLTLAEIAQPAVLRYGNFPLFLRKGSTHTQNEDIAFDCFFGKPVLIGEHHDIFQHPGLVADVITRINTIAPAIRWSNLANVARHSFLKRHTADGVYHIRAYSRAVRLSNEFGFVKRCLIEWKQSPQHEVFCEQVLRNGTPCMGFTSDSDGIRLSVDLSPGSSEMFSMVHRNPHRNLASLGLRWKTRAFARRRLSEVRDNYLSKNSHVLAAAKTLQRCLPR